MQSLTSQMLLTRLILANTQALAHGVDKLLGASVRWDFGWGGVHVDRGWLEEGITLGQSAVSDESSDRSQSDRPMHQGDKVHRTARRPLFVLRATGAARDEQLGEHKTFLKASRWVYSRAATGRGAGCARCPLTTRHTGRSGDSCGNECRTHSRELRRLSLSFGGSAPRRPKRTKPDQGKTQLEQLRGRSYPYSD